MSLLFTINQDKNSTRTHLQLKTGKCIYMLMSLLFTRNTGTRHVQNLQLDTGRRYCSIYTQDNSTRARLYYLHSRQELDTYTFTTQDRQMHIR